MEITITKVKEESGWLSCMSAYPVTHQGINYKTCEALFQALRFEGYPDIQKNIQKCPSPIGAKMITRKNKKNKFLLYLLVSDKCSCERESNDY